MTMYVLHGALGSASQIEPLRLLLDAKSIELPGHGATPLGDREFSIKSFAAFVGETLDVDGEGPVDIFGYSMGGYVALLLALTNPSRVRRVMTLGTKFEWTPEIAAKDAGRLDPGIIETKVPAFAEELKARHTADDWRANLHNTAKLLQKLGDKPLLDGDTLSRIVQPVRICVGDKDVTVSADEATRVGALLPSGSVRVLEHTPHPFEHVDQALLASHIREFFKVTGV